MDACTLESRRLKAFLRAKGAELCRFQTAGGVDLLWGGDPDVWGRHAPILFPAIGPSREDRIRIDGRDYPMPRHGFARDMDFELVRLGRKECTFKLQADEATRLHYPFPFELRAHYALEGPCLKIVFELRNHGDVRMPACLGFHPAFRWPLLPDLGRQQYHLEFEKPEPLPVRRAPGGFLDSRPLPTPVLGRVLPLGDALFRDDVLIFDNLQSRFVRFRSPEGTGLQVSWGGFDSMALWTKPGAGFLCIEPWQGMPDTGEPGLEFPRRPGVVWVGAHSQKEFGLTITVLD